MSRKTTRLLATLTIFLGITAAFTPLGNAVTWSNEKQLTTHGDEDIAPSIVQMNDGRIWVVWPRNVDDWQFDIYYTIYNWSSHAWSEPLPLVARPKHDTSPCIIQTNDGTIWLFWASFKAGGYELFSMKSFDNGETWSNTTRLTDSVGDNLSPSVIQDTNGTIWLVWSSDRAGDWDLFSMKSFDNGETWSNTTQLTTNIYNDESPSIAQMRDGMIWLVWQYQTEDDFQIYYKTYNRSWSNATGLTTSAQDNWSPWIMQARDGTIWVFWSRSFHRGGHPEDPWQDELMCKTSVDDGITWSGVIQLTAEPDWDETSPSAAQINNKTIWLMWESNKDDNFDIYYSISDEIILHDVAITDVTPSSTMAFQGGTISINVTAENQGDENETFTVDCYANTTMIGSEAVTLSSENSTVIVFSWN
nr:hypothetical protein [Gammaproteobacteria bacterium]NIR93928.1 hypothetical protein [Gammaproteobacteria bacterium]NIV93427.1 hypothetical protein [candidate division KSB1 bacterium]